MIFQIKKYLNKFTNIGSFARMKITRLGGQKFKLEWRKRIFKDMFTPVLDTHPKVTPQFFHIHPTLHYPKSYCSLYAIHTILSGGNNFSMN